MAESKRTFQAARMDKDIDDRLLRPGQYRDGLNISIDTSEDANVGAIENLKGNELIANQNIYGLSESSNPNAQVIGSYAHPEEEKIYYFVTGDFVDGIFEYNAVTGVISTILVDGRKSLELEKSELTFLGSSSSAVIRQDGTIVPSSSIGDPISLTPSFPPNTTGSSILQVVALKVKVPRGYANAGKFVSGEVNASQPSIGAPEVQTKPATRINNTNATLNGLLTHNSVNVTSQGFYYGYKTDGTALTISELKNGGTGITRATVSSSTIKQEFKADIGSLVADKLISFAAFATNSIGTTDGSIKTFSTRNTVLSLTSLSFTSSTIGSAGGTAFFTVSGVVGSTYTLAGTDGATAPSGTFTMGSSGSITHSITIGAQSSSAPARSPKVTVTPTGSTAFLPTNLQAFDTIAQAAGTAQTYNYSLTPSASIGNSALKQTALSTGNAYTGFATTQAAGYSATETFYIFPNAGYEFADTSSVSVTGLPSWASASVSQNTNGDNHTYIQVDIAISNTPTNDDSVTYNIAATPTQVVTTWSAGLWTASTNPSAAISPTSDSSISFTGTGTKTASDTITVTDSNKYISSVNSTTKNSTYGGNLITVSYSGIPTSAGGSLTVSFSIAIPADQRKSVTYSSAPIAISLAGATSTYLHRLTHNTSGSNFSLSNSATSETQGITLPTTSLNYAPGATWFSYSVYVQPAAGYKFDNTNQVTLSGVPSWVSYTVSLGSSSFSDHIVINFTWTGQSSDTIDSLTIAASPVGAVLTWSYNSSPSPMAIALYSNYSGTAVMTANGAGTSVIGPGPQNVTLRGTYSANQPSNIVYTESPLSASSTLKDQVSSNGNVTIYSPTHSSYPSGFEHSVAINNTYRKDKTKTTNSATIRYEVYT